MDPSNPAPPPVFLPPGSPPPGPPAPILPIDENGIVIADVLCRKCSYNVRGLHQHGKCPECGTPVGLSIRGNLLCYSDPQWVDKLSRGINLILWGLLAAVLASFAGMGLFFAMGPRAQLLQQLIAVAASTIGFIGAWLLTTPDPGTEEPAQMVTARKIVRFALVFAMAANLLSIFAVGEHPHPMISAIFGIGLVIAALIGVVGEIARLYYLEKIALRIPDVELAKRAKLVRWGYGISLGISGIFGAAFTLMTMTLKQSPGFGPVMMVGGCITGLGALGALAFMIVYIIMLFQFRKALKAQSQFARETWAMASAPASLAPPPVETSRQMGEPS